MDYHLSDRFISAFPQLYRKWARYARGLAHLQDFKRGDGWFELRWQLNAHLEAVLATQSEVERSAYALKERYHVHKPVA